MTLPASGPLTLADIQTEFGGTNPISLNEYYAGGAYVYAGASGTYGAVPSSGQISVQNFYGTSAIPPLLVQNVFATTTYLGVSGSNVTINNGINLTGNGGLIWTKGTNAGNPNSLTDTVRGVSFQVSSNATSEQFGSGISSFTSTGYVTNQQGSTNGGTGENYVSWVFRKQAKFFDIVTWTGDGTSNRAIPHNLGVTPAAYFVKATSSQNQWYVYHKDSGNGAVYINNSGVLNSAAAFTGYPADGLLPNASNIYMVGFAPNPLYGTNNTGVTYVAYLFASNAGGFGASGTENAITCGSFTGSAPVSVTLGWEPQWLLTKIKDSSDKWFIMDSQRGMTSTNSYYVDALYANLTQAQQNRAVVQTTSTGFSYLDAAAGYTYLYIAIRKPM